jgi:hypothetical protein
MIYPTPVDVDKSDPYEGKWEGGGPWTSETYLGTVKWHRAVERVPFGAQIHLYTALNSAQCSKFNLLNLLEVNRKL